MTLTRERVMRNSTGPNFHGRREYLGEINGHHFVRDTKDGWICVFWDDPIIDFDWTWAHRDGDNPRHVHHNLGDQMTAHMLCFLHKEISRK